MTIRILIGVGIFLLISIVGLLNQILITKNLIKNRNFLVDYSNMFVKYAKQNGSSHFDYLVSNLDQAQAALGAHGFASVCRPFESFYRNGVPVLTLLMDINDERNSSYDMSRPYIDLIHSALTIAIGASDLVIKNSQRNLYNIFINFYKGFNWIISAPFVALSYMFTGKNIFKGHISQPINAIWHVFSFILQIVGVLSGIMSIILGYQDFYNLIASWFH